MRSAVVLSIIAFLQSTPGRAADPLVTVAEASNYQKTSPYADVMAFCEKLAKESPRVKLGELGTSQEGRKLPLLILADPPITNAKEARASGKPVLFAIGNIHAGEVDGKEALLMLARDIARAKESPILKDLIVIFAPIFNADGNERFADNRPEQNGPKDVGIRTNAQELDLNRDYIKLESPEVRAFVRFLNEWDPAVYIDLHTTNGSLHRYTLTYEGASCPAGDPRPIALVREKLLPEVNARMEKATGYKSYFYGNFDRDRSHWETVPATPRYGFHYVGLRNRLAVLSESYSHASFKDRVLVSYAFTKGICEYAAENRTAITKMLGEVRESSIRADAKEEIVLRHKPAPFGRPHKLLGFVEEIRDGKRISTDRPKEYELLYMGGAEPTLKVRRPSAYLIPAAQAKAIENLKLHGIATEELKEAVERKVEVYRVDKIARAAPFQKHRAVTLEVTPRTELRKFPAGTVVVRTAQPLGPLAAYLLEPQAADGLTTWNFFDDALKVGEDYPVVRDVD